MTHPFLQINRGRRLRKPRVLVYGPPKVGKTTFASAARDPIFIGNEDGADQVDVAKFPPPARWGEAEQQILFLLNEPHEFQTVVLDTLDWLEPLLVQHIVEAARAPSLNDGQLSYGRGKQRLLEEWRKTLARLEQLREKRDMTVIVLAHAQVRTFANPSGEDYDRWTLKCNDATSGLFSEWVDVFAFAAPDLQVTKEGKAIPTGNRALHVTGGLGWDAGSRYDLPSPLPLSWPSLAMAIKQSHDSKAAPEVAPEAGNPPQEATENAATS